MQIATVNRLKGLILIQTLISHIISSFQFTLRIFSVLTVEKRLLTHLRKGKNKLSSKAPQSPSLVRSLKKSSSFFHPLALVPFLTSLHSTAVGSKLQNCAFL